MLGGGLKQFLFVTPTWGRFPFWSIFFNCVGSTTKLVICFDSLYLFLKTPSHRLHPHLGAAGMAFRVPTPDVSVVDLTFTAEKV